MTLKNLLINTEKPTRILHYRTAWRLPSVICILISFICILSGQNNCFAQDFISSEANSYYPSSNNSVVPPSSLGDGYAVLVWSHTPASSVSQGTVLDANIVSSYQYVQNSAYIGSFGYYTVSKDIRTWYTIIDPSNIYVKTGTVNSFMLSQINTILSRKSLSTVQQRRNYIHWLNNNVTTIVNPVDFRGYIQPWIVVGLVIAILIPAWYLMRRFLRG